MAASSFLGDLTDYWKYKIKALFLKKKSSKIKLILNRVQFRRANTKSFRSQTIKKEKIDEETNDTKIYNMHLVQNIL